MQKGSFIIFKHTYQHTFSINMLSNSIFFLCNKNVLFLIFHGIDIQGLQIKTIFVG